MTPSAVIHLPPAGVNAIKRNQIVPLSAICPRLEK
jgi:hypothetical protein